MKNILYRIKNENNAGYFYKDNCRILWSDLTSFYCKDFDVLNNKMNTYNITKNEARKLIKESLK
jgi:hypothetical protein